MTGALPGSFYPDSRRKTDIRTGCRKARHQYKNGGCTIAEGNEQAKRDVIELVHYTGYPLLYAILQL